MRFYATLFELAQEGLQVKFARELNSSEGAVLLSIHSGNEVYQPMRLTEFTSDEDIDEWLGKVLRATRNKKRGKWYANRR